MSAAARAEARRKAILSRGTDRLSKLTTTARGDDAPQFAHSDPPAPSAPQGNLSNFLGEDPLPDPIASDPPSRRAPNPRIPPSNTTPGLGGSKRNPPPDPSALSSEQQQQILQALLGGTTPPRTFDINAQATGGTAPDDPLLALLSSMGIQGGMGQGANVTPQSRTEPEPKTAIQKLFPLLHVIAVWALLAYFIFWQEPEAFQARNSVVITSGNIWNRWAKLASGTAAQSTWGVETVPFFWAFVSLELALTSTRIFFHFDSTQPPLLLTLALPYLPKPLPSIITYSLRYMQLLGTLLDDLAAAVVAMGLFIVASSLYSNWLFT